MAKSKSRKKSKSSSGPEAQEKKGVSKQHMITLVVIAGIVIAGGWWWNENRKAESLFFEQVRQGDGTLDRVERIPDHGTSGHLSPGERVDYGSRTPTSGRHDTRWVTPGIYDSIQLPAMLVHSLEHGMVVIYYDRLDADTMATLEDWNGLYAGPFTGIVMTRQAGLGEKLVLTAWRKSLTLERFDAPAAAAFIDAYRGRGPENPVR